LYTSRTLSNIWTNGFANIGEANVKAGYYIASYALKSIKQELTDENGEIYEVSDSMDSSRRPALGLNYLKRNYKQLIDLGERLPRYYIKKMREFGELKRTKEGRIKLAKKSLKERTLMYKMWKISHQYDDKIFFQRTPQEKLAKFQNYRQKIRQDSDFRQKNFTKAENLIYKNFKQDVLTSIAMEVAHGKNFNSSKRPQN
jgi:hypothetical protein